MWANIEFRSFPTRSWWSICAPRFFDVEVPRGLEPGLRGDQNRITTCLCFWRLLVSRKIPLKKTDMHKLRSVADMGRLHHNCNRLEYHVHLNRGLSSHLN